MVLQKRQNVTSKHHTDLSKTQNNGKISVLKKMELARGREMTQIKKKKKADQFSKRRLFSKTFSTSVNYSLRNVKNQREKF